MTFDDDILARAARILGMAREKRVTIATAESCTGGLVAGALTEIAGSSDVFDRGFVTYSNRAKIDMLGVRAATLDAHGAVSGETAAEMAEGAIRNSGASLALSVTGIAGPGGGSAEKPIGLVWFGMPARGARPARSVYFLPTLAAMGFALRACAMRWGCWKARWPRLFQTVAAAGMP